MRVVLKGPEGGGNVAAMVVGSRMERARGVRRTRKGMAWGGKKKKMMSKKE